MQDWSSKDGSRKLWNVKNDGLAEVVFSLVKLVWYQERNCPPEWARP
jgi:hypothetical protein